MDTSPRKVAIVAALEREIRPLVRGWRSYRLPAADGLHRLRFFESESAVVVCGGIGREAATEAARAAIERFRPQVVVSAGFAGAIAPELRVAALLDPEKVIAAKSGTAFETGGEGKGVLVTVSEVAGREEKRRLAERFSAQAVDMEAAAVARAAQAEGVRFRALKAISDEADFPLPPAAGFIDASGTFHTLRFALYLVLRPWLWRTAREMGRNCSRAAEALAGALTTFIRQAEQGGAPASSKNRSAAVSAAGVEARS